MFDDEIYDEDESLIVSTKTEYDEIENILRPKSMEGYVGQEKVKNKQIYPRENHGPEIYADKVFKLVKHV